MQNALNSALLLLRNEAMKTPLHFMVASCMLAVPRSVGWSGWPVVAWCLVHSAHSAMVVLLGWGSVVLQKYLKNLGTTRINMPITMDNIDFISKITKFLEFALVVGEQRVETSQGWRWFLCIPFNCVNENPMLADFEMVVLLEVR
jgi:hypothetical protein